MKKVPLENSCLSDCVTDSQVERIVVTESGRPVAVIMGLERLDAEQLALCEDAEFWKMIAQRRQSQRATISREELERQLAEEP